MDNVGYKPLAEVPYPSMDVPNNNSININVTNSNGPNLTHPNRQPTLNIAQTSGQNDLNVALTNTQDAINMSQGQTLLNITQASSDSNRNIAPTTTHNILQLGPMNPLVARQHSHVSQLTQPPVAMATLHSSTNLHPQPVVAMATMHSSTHLNPQPVVAMANINSSTNLLPQPLVAMATMHSSTNLQPQPVVAMATMHSSANPQQGPVSYITYNSATQQQPTGYQAIQVTSASNVVTNVNVGPMIVGAPIPDLAMSNDMSPLVVSVLKAPENVAQVAGHILSPVLQLRNDNLRPGIKPELRNPDASSLLWTNVGTTLSDSQKQIGAFIVPSNVLGNSGVSHSNASIRNNQPNTAVLNYVAEGFPGSNCISVPSSSINVPSSNRTMSSSGVYEVHNLQMLGQNTNVVASMSNTLTSVSASIPKDNILSVKNSTPTSGLQTQVFDSSFQRNLVKVNGNSSFQRNPVEVNENSSFQRNPVEVNENSSFQRNPVEVNENKLQFNELESQLNKNKSQVNETTNDRIQNDIETNSVSNNMMYLDEQSGLVSLKQGDEDVLNNEDKVPDFTGAVLNNIEKVPEFSSDLSNKSFSSVSNASSNDDSDTDIDDKASCDENHSNTVGLSDSQPLTPLSLDQSEQNDRLYLDLDADSSKSQPASSRKNSIALKVKFRRRRIQNQQSTLSSVGGEKEVNVIAVKKRRRKKKWIKSSQSIPTCHLCSKTYSNNDILKRHIASVHEKSFDKFCSVCNKGFINMYALKVHSLSHSGIKPFQCEEPDCNNTYSTKQLLQFHYRFLHGYSDTNMPNIEKKKNLFPKNSFVTHKSTKNCREYFDEFGVKVREESMDIEPPVVKADNSDPSGSENGDENELKTKDAQHKNTKTSPDEKNIITKGRKIKTPTKKLKSSDSLDPKEQEEAVSEGEDGGGVDCNGVEDRDVQGSSIEDKPRRRKVPKEVPSICPKKRKQSEIDVEYSWIKSRCLGRTKLPTIIPASTREIQEALLSNCQTCYTCHVEDRCPLKYPEYIVPNDLDYPMGFFMPELVLFGKSRAYPGKSSLFARDNIDPFTRFGPLLGRPLNIDDLKTLNVADIELEHFWPVITDEDSPINVSMYIDTKDVTQSNWLRFLLPAPYSENNNNNFNLQRVMLNNEVYFVTTRKVRSGEELLMRALEPPERLFYNLAAQQKENKGGSCFLCRKHGKDDHDEEEHSGSKTVTNDDQLPAFDNTLWFVRHFRLEHNIGHGCLNFATMYMCYVCNVEFNSKAECNKHKNNYHPEVVGKRPSLHQCPICYEKVTCKPSVKYHRAKFHPRLSELGPQKCPKCDRVLESQAQLLSHLNKSHNPKDHRPVTCNVCQKIYKNAAVLKRHMDKTHDRKFYKFCDLCGKSFRDMYQLRVHSLTHSGVKPFQCEMPQCTNGFTTKQWLQKHYRTTHGFTDENMPAIQRKVSFDDIT